MESTFRARPASATSLQDRLETIEAVIREFQLPALASRVESIREIASGEGIVDVVVVGQYKAGKSSMLNALMGRDVLPVDVLPATSVVTRVSRSPRDEVVIHFLGGATKIVPASALRDYVTESANPDNVKNVLLADVRIAGDAVLNGVRFVDTPGLGSIFAHNSERAREWLPRVGVALVAVRVDQPFGEADWDLIRDLEAHTPDIAIVLTKSDLVGADQIANVIRFTRETLLNRLGREVPLIPFSVRVGLDESVAALSGFLGNSAAGQAAERTARIALYKLDSLRHACRVYLERELAAARAGEDAIATLRGLVEVERARFRVVEDELRRLGDFHGTRAVNDCAEHFRGAIAPAIGRVKSRLAGQIGTWDGTLADLTAHYARWMEAAIAGELEGLREEG
ncbi:MAG: dynamin family protein, partial [Deltaproteobacteria bacterium]|nr:dynamin family protein [Deltaproteobacteria bacterium]